MITMNSEINCELLVIGAGLSGMASALFAANRGVSTVQAGIANPINFASGLLDLLAVHPIEDGKIWNNPFAAIDALVKDMPEHPYALIDKEDIEKAFDEFISFLNETGLSYLRHQNCNAEVLTPIGTIKQTYYVPQSMWNGVKALKDKLPCLLVDFHGLKGYSAKQIKETLQKKWPGLRDTRISFPDTSGELYVEHIARMLEKPNVRRKLAKDVLPNIKDAQSVGLPAVLGISRTKEVISELEKLLKVPIFEIPTMPPSIPGLRLSTVFEKMLPKLGVQTLFQQKVLNAELSGSGKIIFEIGSSSNIIRVQAKGAILASGRFFGKGLHAEKEGIRETIFNLSVHQVWDRTLWHNINFWDQKGHPINQAGLEIDRTFRPLDKSGSTAHETLFAAGSILAHQDWMRMKCGAGLAIATAYAAVNSLLKHKT